jgi:hypothetical protein
MKVNIPSTDDAAVAARITGRYMEEDPRLRDLVCNLLGAQLEISTYVKVHYASDMSTIDVFLFCLYHMAMNDLEEESN